MKNHNLILIIALLLILPTVLSNNVLISIPSDDTTIDFNNPNTNYGSSNSWFVVDNDGSGNEDRSIYIKFNIDEIYGSNVDNTTISAELGLYMTGTIGSSPYYYNVTSFYLNNQTWNEDEPTYNSQINPTPSTYLDYKLFNVGSNTNEYYYWNVTYAVKSEITNTNSYVSLFLNSTDFNSDDDTYNTYVRFKSKEYFGSDDPILNITYDPFIAVNSPLSAEKFTNNSGIAKFNITNNTMVDYCYGTLDSETNYTLSYQGNNVWYSDTSNLNNGSHTIIYYCNKTTSGDMIITDSIDFYVDTISPVINILYPTNTTYGESVISLNSSISDGGSLDTCWYSLNNGVSNITFSCLSNITGLDSGGGFFTWWIWANDSLGQMGSNVAHFTVDLSYPVTSLDYPENNEFFDYQNDIYFNFTSSEDNNIDTCELWTNTTNSWHNNQTIFGVVPDIQNSTLKNVSDGTFIWNVWCNDSLGNGGFSPSNYSFTVDTTDPQFNSVDITTTNGSQTVSFNVSDYTEINCNNTFYSVYNYTGQIDNSIENETSNCDPFTGSFTVSDYGDYTLRTYINDKASNQNYTDTNFTVSQLTVNITVIGGGGGGSTVVYSLVDAVNYSIVSRSFGNLLDIVVAKDSVRPRNTNFVLVNQYLKPIEIKLLCDTELLNESQITDESNFVNICDYVELENTDVILTPNELENAYIDMKIRTPENASFGDVYNFNILALYDDGSGNTQYDKLSVSVRVPIWAIILKWSYLPLRSEGFSYPVSLASISLSFLLFVSLFIPLKRKLPTVSFFVALFLSMVLFLLVIILL